MQARLFLLATVFCLLAGCGAECRPPGAARPVLPAISKAPQPSEAAPPPPTVAPAAAPVPPRSRQELLVESVALEMGLLVGLQDAADDARRQEIKHRIDRLRADRRSLYRGSSIPGEVP